jgi:hypothetical protein
MNKIASLVLLCVLCKLADAQTVIAGQDQRNERTVAVEPSASLRINPTNGVVPVRSSATAFSNSPLSVDVNGNLEIGTNPAPDSANGGLTMVGTFARSKIVEIHNNYAVGIDLYTHSDEEFRAPYLNLYKSRGTQTAPTPVMFTGYELDSIGGINFGGWDGSKYGSAQQSVRVRILRGFLKSDEFGLCGGQALRLQQQIVHVAITTAATKQSFDVAVDGFHHTHRYLRPAIVQDALEMIQQHAG